MKWILGLGNPGLKYAATRHNFGFLCLDRLAARWRHDHLWELRSAREQPRLARWQVWARGDLPHPVILLWPLTFMNVSGEALVGLASRLSVELRPEDLLVVVDDLSLELGQMRLRARGSSGGHNGLKSVQAALGTADYARLRLGIGSPPAGLSVVDYVLGEFSEEETRRVEAGSAFAAECLEEWGRGVSFPHLVGKVNAWREGQPSTDSGLSNEVVQ